MEPLLASRDHGGAPRVASTQYAMLTVCFLGEDVTVLEQVVVGKHDGLLMGERRSGKFECRSDHAHRGWERGGDASRA